MTARSSSGQPVGARHVVGMIDMMDLVKTPRMGYTYYVATRRSIGYVRKGEFNADQMADAKEPQLCAEIYRGLNTFA